MNELALPATSPSSSPASVPDCVGAVEHLVDPVGHEAHRGVGGAGRGAGDPLQRRRHQRRGAAQGLLGEHHGQPLDGGLVGGDQPLGEVLDPRQLGRAGEHLDVGGAVEQLVLQLQVVSSASSSGSACSKVALRTADSRPSAGVTTSGHATEGAQLLGDEAGPLRGVVGVLHQLAAHGVGAGLETRVRATCSSVWVSSTSARSWLTILALSVMRWDSRHRGMT